MGTFSRTGLPSHDCTESWNLEELPVLIVGEMLSQTAEAMSSPSIWPRIGVTRIGPTETFCRCHSVKIHRAPKAAPASAPMTVTLEELQSPASLRLSR